MCLTVCNTVIQAQKRKPVMKRLQMRKWLYALLLGGCVILAGGIVDCPYPQPDCQVMSTGEIVCPHGW